MAYLTPHRSGAPHYADRFIHLGFPYFKPDRCLSSVLRRWHGSPDNTAFFVSLVTEASHEILEWFVEHGFPVVYRHVDFFTSDHFPNFDRELAIDFSRKANLVTLSHPDLVDQVPKNSKTLIVTNGIDTEFFPGNATPQSLPTDLRTGELTLGFWGTGWGERLDWDLLKGLALQKPAWAINLITEPVDELLPENLVVLGRKHPRELQDYLQSFDVCLVPFKRDQEFAKYSNPLKVLEYLSGRRPVVSPPNSSLISYPGVFFYDGLHDLAETVCRAAAAELDGDKIRAFVEERSWDNKVANLLERLSESLRS